MLTNMKGVQELVVDDYHLTPMDRYAHPSIEIAKKILLEIPFIEGHDYISADTISNAKEIPQEEQKTESEIVGAQKDVEEQDEGEKKYTQISIFDED